MSGRPNSLREDPGYWLCAFLIVIFPPLWVVGLIALIWNLPEIIRENRLERECKERGQHLWGEYQDHPFWDIPHQYCQHCHCANPDSYQPLTTNAEQK
jgi:hypothetical protein